MAGYQAVAVTGQAILGVLADARPRPEFEAAQFDLYQAADLRSPMEDGLSLYLYRVAVNTARRTLPPRLGANGSRFRPSLLLDLHYLLSAWARSAARQQRLLTWAVRTLEDTPLLPSGVLNAYAPEPDVFHAGEGVELILDSPSLQDLAAIWDPFKPTVALSVGYVARAVAVDSDALLPDAAPVQTRVFELAGSAE